MMFTQLFLACSDIWDGAGGSLSIPSSRSSSPLQMPCVSPRITDLMLHNAHLKPRQFPSLAFLCPLGAHWSYPLHPKCFSGLCSDPGRPCLPNLSLWAPCPLCPFPWPGTPRVEADSLYADWDLLHQTFGTHSIIGFIIIIVVVANVDIIIILILQKRN